MAQDFHARVKYHASHIGNHLGGHAEVEAVAKAECDAAHASTTFKDLACFESQVAVGSFTATKIAIRGGNYKWRNTGDGYFTVYDVPLVSEWKKGDHGAPYDGDKETLEEFVATAQERYKAGNFCATAYKRHNPDIPIDHPDFRGYALPNRVGKYTLEKGDKWTIFGDLKLSKEGFEEARGGRIPYISVEIPWTRRRIRGVSFQDTLPPEYEYANFTVGDEVTDPNLGNFKVSPESVGKFMEETKKEEPAQKKDDGEDFEKKIDGHLSKNLGKYIDQHMQKNISKYMSDMKSAGALIAQTDPFPRKAQALPAEPGNVEGGMKMTDPEVAAKLVAQAGKIEDLTTRLDKQDQDKVAARFVAKAEQTLAMKILTPAIKEQIATFATEWSALKDGTERMDKFVDALKPSLKDKPITSVGAMTSGAIDLTNPVLAKIAKDGPEMLEEAGKFSAQYQELKRKLGDRMTSTEEQYVKNEIGLAKAKRDGLFVENGR